MDAPLNAGIRELMAATTVKSFLDERGLRSLKPVVLSSDATVGEAMESLVRHKVRLREA